MSTGFSLDWLSLRESADAEARASELLVPLSAYLTKISGGTEPLVIRDLGCGSGSQGRWLAGRLPGPQHWILHDHDPELLDRAGLFLTGTTAADGSPITVEARLGDLADLDAEDLGGTSLLTASALLDLLTSGEVDRLAEACAAVGCPVLLTLSVVGRVEFSPADPLDADLAEAFNLHQRRSVEGRRLLGPDAVTVATTAFENQGMTVLSRPSPWRLGPEQSALTAEWLRGWVEAAVEQRPDLVPWANAYLADRIAICTAGDLNVQVHHRDLLALPGGVNGEPLSAVLPRGEA